MAEDIVQQTADTQVQAPAEVVAPVTESESLSDHEAQFGPSAAREADDDGESTPERDRNARGQFKRHRARSQQAGPEDVPRIQELTRKLREAEAERDRLKTAGAATTPAPAVGAQPQAVERPAATPAPRPTPPKVAAPETPAQSFPGFESWLEQNEGKTYEDYVDARADWRYAINTAQARQKEAAEQAQRTEQERLAAHLTRVTAAKAKYTDFDTVVNGSAIVVSPVMRNAILASEQSADLVYFLSSHPDIARELADESWNYDPSAPNVMRRALEKELALFVASQRPAQPQRTQAATTGSALALVQPPAPKPPNPVRTGALNQADEPPGDESSLAAHEQFYGRRRRG